MDMDVVIIDDIFCSKLPSRLYWPVYRELGE